MEELGARLKALRMAAGLTQAQFAEKLNMHLQTVSKWERNVCAPDIAVLGDIADILGVSIEKVLGAPEGDRTYTGRFDAVRSGKRLQKLRSSRGESQRELAAIVPGVSADTVSKWERGVVCPDAEELCALAAHFAVPVSQLYYAAEDAPARTPVRAARKRRSKWIYGAVAVCVIAAVLVTALLTRTPAPMLATYTVTVDEETYEVGENDWFMPAVPEKRGYDFKEFIDANGDCVTFPRKITGDETYRAVFTPTQYAIDYWLNGGVFSGDVCVTFTADEVFRLPVPTKAGARFEGWFTAADYGGAAIQTLTCSFADVTLYAKWSDETYTVRYELGGGTLSNGNPATVTKSQAVDLRSPLRKGYVFLGWFDAPEGGNRHERVGGENARNLTLYAVWQQQDGAFSIGYELNGGAYAAGESNPAQIGAGEVSALCAPEKRGYDFAGWFDIDGTRYTALAGLRADLVLYARYTPKTYTVRYELNGGTYEVSANPNEIAYGQTVSLRALVKYGHAFAGWYDAPEGGKRVTRIDTDNLPYLHTLYARFTQNAYTVRLNAGEGTFTANGEERSAYDYTLTFGEELRLPECTAAGKVFAGWRDERGATVQKIDATNIGNITLTAAYTAANDTYALTLQTCGGALAGADTLTVACNQSVKLPVPTRAQHRFLGWNDRADGSGVYYTYTSGSWTQDTTLYAVWQEISIGGSNANFTYEKGQASVTITKYTGPIGENADMRIPSYIDGLPVVRITGLVTPAFPLCRFFHSVTLPDTLQYLGERALSGLAICEPFTLPAAVREIGAYCFKGTECTLRFAEGSALTEIGPYAFADARFSDATLVLPEGIATLRENAFRGCLVKWLQLPQTLRNIESGALYLNRDSDVQPLYLPSGVAFIEANAFGLPNVRADLHVYTTLSAAQTEQFDLGWDTGVVKTHYISHASLVLRDEGEEREFDTSCVLPDRAKDGYTFIGWQATDGSVYRHIFIAESDTVLTALYEPISADDGRDISRPARLQIGGSYTYIVSRENNFYFTVDTAVNVRIKITIVPDLPLVGLYKIPLHPGVGEASVGDRIYSGAKFEYTAGEVLGHSVGDCEVYRITVTIER